MSKDMTIVPAWPTRSSGAPILKTTNDAFLYAQLIYKRKDKQYALASYRQQTYRILKQVRENENPDLDYMMELAVRAQFYRECLEECQRIKDEKFNTPAG